jgi:predicted DNA-binding antitoxin AbrB/MazE fold protein
VFKALGSKTKAMKNHSIFNPFIQSLLLRAFVLMGCNGGDTIPASSDDKITNLVVQAESQTNNFTTAVDLTHQKVVLENLSLSADYFVDESHFDAAFGKSKDSSNAKEPWQLSCKNHRIISDGFGQSLAEVDLSAGEKVKIMVILEDYHRMQSPLLRNQFEIIERLNDSVENRIEQAIEVLNSGNCTMDSFQIEIQSIENWFTENLKRERVISKNAIHLSVNYRNTLDAIKQLLSEKQFKQFYICHKR